jgi:hypothetical protein
LQCLSGYSPDHPIVVEILIQVSHLHKSGRSVVFYCVPGHTGLPGNEAADVAAKVAALHRMLVSDRALCSDVYTFLHCTILSSWQDKWDNAQGNKLRMLKPSVQVWLSSFSAIRKEEVTFTCLQVSHMWLTHGHLLCDDWRLSVVTVVSHLLWYISWWNAHIVPKPAVSIIFTVCYPTCLVTISVAPLMFWLLYQ